MKLQIFKCIDGVYDVSNYADVHYNLPYASISDKNKLDLYTPINNRDKYPLLVFIHSGGFFKSDKARHLSNILNGLLFDYAVASINYRLNDETDYCGSRQDVIQALNHLSHMKSIDVEKIVLWGESYGAYLALDIAVNHKKELSFQPAGIVDMYCACDLLDFHQYKKKQGQELIVRGKDNDFHTFGDDLKLMEESRFLGRFTGKEPPICIIHGVEDTVIPLRYSQMLENDLKRSNNRFEVHYVEGVGHGIDHYRIPQYNGIIFDFIQRVLQEKKI